MTEESDITTELVDALTRAEDEIQRMWSMLRDARADASAEKLQHVRTVVRLCDARGLLREALEDMQPGPLAERIYMLIEMQT